MKINLLALVIILTSLFSAPIFSQTNSDTELLGLPGDNLDLYAVLDLFQKSKTIEDFEKSLNDSVTGINNLDLNLDGKVDFIKVVTKQKDQDFTFILQVDVTEKETQDVAVILLSKDKNDKVTLQIVGDKDLYGENYVVEPKPAAPPVTPNPAYTGNDPVTVTTPASTTVVVVESAPIVQYVYSPVYVPYYPPYHYGYYPPYFAAFTVMAVGVYCHNNYYHHYPYHGGYGNTTVVVHNTNNYNNYNNYRNSSNTVNHNKANGNYKSSGTMPAKSGGAKTSTTPAKGNGAKPSTTPSNKSGGAKPSTTPSDKSGGAKPSTTLSNKSGGAKPSSTQSARPASPSTSTRQAPSSSYSGGGRSGGGYGGGYSGGGRSGGGFSGGGGGGRGGRR